MSNGVEMRNLAKSVGLTVLLIALVIVPIGLLIGRVDKAITPVCFRSPLGGVPVDVQSFRAEPYVCGWTSEGYRCLRMEPCQ